MIRGLALAPALGLALAFGPAASPARAVTIEDLQAMSIQLRVGYDMRVRRAEGTFDTQMNMVWKFKVDPEGRLVGDITRTVTTPRGPQSRTHPMKGRIGKPGEAATGGQGLWLIEGDTLILLRAFEAGGYKAEIEFSGSPPKTCKVRAPFVREEGKGHVQTQQSVVGGPVTVLSAKQISSDCRILR